MSELIRRTSGLVDRAGALVSRFNRPIRDALILVGVGRAVVYFGVQGIHPWTFVGIDARAYWRVDLAHPYTGSGVGEVSTYLYSPPFAQITAPLSLLPFEAFYVVWLAAMLAALAWLVRPWPQALLILSLPISYELFVGNVHYFIAVAVALGLRRPWPWALPVLTKITPAVGLLWHVVRREWRPLGFATAVLAGICGMSAILAPAAWLDWFALLLTSPGRSELLMPRLVAAALLVAFGAATGRRWLVPVAVFIALPVVWVNSWVILLATIRLRERTSPASP